MSAILNASVEGDDGSAFDVAVKPRTVLQWEKRYPGRRLDQIDEKFQYLYELVFIAAKGQLPEGLTFEAFCDGYDVAPKAAPAADPTPPAA